MSIPQDAARVAFLAWFERECDEDPMLETPEARVLAWRAWQAARAIPAGWALVPIEPTRDMWQAVNKLDDEMAAGGYDGKGCSIEQAWECLIEHAPSPLG